MRAKMGNWFRRPRQISDPNCQSNQQLPSCQAQQDGTQAAPTPDDNSQVSSVVTVISPSASFDASPSTDTGAEATTATTIAFTTDTLSNVAVVTSQPSAVQTTSGSSNNNGVNKGAVAGIAIGTCIAGAAIAFIVAVLLFKRRDKRLAQKTCPSGYPIYADSSPELTMVQKSAAIGSPYVHVSQTQMRTPVPVPARVPVSSQRATNEDVLAGVLPPAASEHDIQNRVSGLFNQIHRHIDTYYRDVHASITPSMNMDLATFGKDVDMLESLQDCSSPTTPLKHALIAFVLEATEPRSNSHEQTLWPNELGNFAASSQGIGSASTQLAKAQALHRRLSVYLYMQNKSFTSNSQSQSRLSNLSALSLTRKTSSAIREAAEHFSLTFFPWANPTFGDHERESDLAGIIGEALECRIWLCGQRGEWKFEWEVPETGVVVVTPALVVKDEGNGPRRVVMHQSVLGL